MIVAEELILRHVDDVDVRPAVVVEVADRHAHAVTLSRNSGLFRDVGERAVAVVVEQPVPVLRVFFLSDGIAAPFTR